MTMNTLLENKEDNDRRSLSSLKVIEYLKANGIPELIKNYGIKVVFDDNQERMILNYDQIDSPKFDPIVEECRGLVLDKNFDLVARSFPRFYNWGESNKPFIWENHTCVEKVDGSLVLIYYWKDSWHINTRGSFANGYIDRNNTRIWKDEISKLVPWNKLCKKVTYVCEFCSPWNRVVIEYKVPKLYLLATYFKHDEIVLEQDYFECPKEYKFSSYEEIKLFLEEKEFDLEGFVVRDIENTRYKIKSQSYVNLHHIKNNGAPDIERIVELCLNGEAAEIMACLPELKDLTEKVENFCKLHYNIVEDLWNKTKSIENQKEFALAIVKETPFNSLLFTLRKNPKVTLSDLWRNNAKSIAAKFKPGTQNVP